MSKRFIEYNNNPKHRNTGDCVTRALAKVFRQTWTDTYMELARNACETGYLSTSALNYDKILVAHGYVSIPVNGTRLTVNQVTAIQDHYLRLSPRWAIQVEKHLTAAVDGKIYDTWDCSRRQVKRVYVPVEQVTLVKNEIIALCEKKGYNITWN